MDKNRQLFRQKSSEIKLVPPTWQRRALPALLCNAVQTAERKQCHFFILCLTETALGRPHVLRETSYDVLVLLSSASLIPYHIVGEGEAIMDRGYFGHGGAI